MVNKRYFGYIAAFSAYIMWGLLPIYWKQLGYLTSGQLLAIRIIMTVITLGAVIHIGSKPLYLSYIKDKKTRYGLMLSALFITINWGVFVYAINVDQVIQASLGYYINPLVSVFMGIFVMKERLSKIQYLSIALAFIGVGYMTISYGSIPWIALALAFSFAFYGLLKKMFYLDSMNSLMVEVIYISPFMVYILLKSDVSLIVDQTNVVGWVLILVAGIVTTVPLVLFAEGVKKIPLSTIGFLQYIAPTLMLLLGVLKYGEVFTRVHSISFTFIWIGLAVFSYSAIRSNQSEKIIAEIES